jgi:acyl phosphate:glycerol-3-phosphate acyltransferase
LNAFLALLAAYLIGSVSFGFMAGKLLKGIDIREFGSGGTGTTNIQRTLGTGPALAVLVLDAAKGYLAIWVAGMLTANPSGWLLLAGLAAVGGHNWPLFHRFRGGRGIATSIGVMLGLAPLVILIATAVGVTLIAITRYVSLGSIVGSMLIPVFMIFFGMPWTYILFGVALAAFAVWRHRPNIARLLAGNENKLGQKVRIGTEEKKVE